MVLHAQSESPRWNETLEARAKEFVSKMRPDAADAFGAGKQTIHEALAVVGGGKDVKIAARKMLMSSTCVFETCSQSIATAKTLSPQVCRDFDRHLSCCDRSLP